MSNPRLWTAMVTPFDDQGDVCLKKTSALIEHMLANGTEGLVVSGTTGESPTLTKDEKLKLFEHVVKVVNKRVPVYAGTGSNSTKVSVEFSQEAEALGVDGIMLVGPYYNKPSQRGLYQHFKTIADSIKLPVMIYNVPGRTAKSIDPDTIVELAKVDNITSVKEASGNLDNMAHIISKTPDDFHLYSGDDGLTLPVMAIGGNGIVSVASQVIGNEMLAMINAYVDGKVKEASEWHLKILPVMRELFATPSPTPTKTLLNELGVDVGDVRAPMICLTPEERERLTTIYHGMA